MAGKPKNKASRCASVAEPRPYSPRTRRMPTVETRPSSPIACALCGGPGEKRRRRHCDACMPKARRAHGLRAMETARKALAAQSAAGNDPRRGAAVNRVRSEAISEGHRRNRSWAREHPGRCDEAWFRREIATKLDAFSLKEIAAATGLSLASCSLRWDRHVAQRTYSAADAFTEARTEADEELGFRSLCVKHLCRHGYARWVRRVAAADRRERFTGATHFTRQ